MKIDKKKVMKMKVGQILIHCEKSEGKILETVMECTGEKDYKVLGTFLVDQFTPMGILGEMVKMYES